eukprot:6489689-Amphidinium_carterae.3
MSGPQQRGASVPQGVIKANSERPQFLLPFSMLKCNSCPVHEMPIEGSASAKNLQVLTGMVDHPEFCHSTPARNCMEEPSCVH